MPSANILRKAALAALLNAQDLYDEGKFLAQADYLARAAALAVIGIEECAKAVVYVSAALFPDKSERFLEKLNRHDVKHLISAEFEGAEIVTHEWSQILSQQTGLDVSREYRLVDIISEFSAIYASDKDRSTKKQVEDHHEMMKPENDDNLSTPYIKNAALYVDINSEGEIDVPKRVSKYGHREIVGLKWNLDELYVLKEILSADKRWDSFCTRIHTQIQAK